MRSAALPRFSSKIPGFILFSILNSGKTEFLNGFPNFIIDIAEGVVAVEVDEGDPGAGGGVGLAGAEGNNVIMATVEDEGGDGALEEGVVVALVVGDEIVVQRNLSLVAVVVDRVVACVAPLFEGSIAQPGEPVVEEAEGGSQEHQPLDLGMAIAQPRRC